MKKKYLLLFSLLSLGSFDKKEIKQKPNILFILLDDMGKEWVSSFNADNIETPNIEKSFHFFELISNYGADSL